MMAPRISGGSMGESVRRNTQFSDSTVIKFYQYVIVTVPLI